MQLCLLLKKDLESDRQLLSAVTRELEILGEAANNISKDTQDQIREIPWRTFIGSRCNKSYPTSNKHWNKLFKSSKALKHNKRSLCRFCCKKPFDSSFHLFIKGFFHISYYNRFSNHNRCFIGLFISKSFDFFFL